MKYLNIVFLASIMFFSACTNNQPVLKVGLVADPQYANKPTRGKRYYKESLWKLSDALDTFNLKKVDFIQNLGDVIDDEWSSFDSIMPVYERLNPDIKSYQLLGNHDYSVDSNKFGELLTTLSMPDFYYSYVKEDWRFIVLDATDYAYYSNFLHKYPIEDIDASFNLTEGKSNNYNWNSGIGSKQKAWLKEELKKAEAADQKVILFSHMPIKPLGNAHNLWNDFEIIDIIESSPSVVAFINGHNHAGEYFVENGIHYLTIFGMVDTKIGSFGILELYEDRMVLTGYGNQKSMVLELGQK